MNPDLLRMFSELDSSVIVLLPKNKEEEEDEDSLLLQEMLRHNKVMENRPYIVPSPG